VNVRWNNWAILGIWFVFTAANAGDDGGG